MTEIEKDKDIRTFDQPDSELPPIPVVDEADGSIITNPDESAVSDGLGLPQSDISEKDMGKKLMDMDSSFIPDNSTLSDVSAAGPGLTSPALVGPDDTFLYGGSPGRTITRPPADGKGSLPTRSGEHSMDKQPSVGNVEHSGPDGSLELSRNSSSDLLDGYFKQSNNAHSSHHLPPSSPTAAAAERYAVRQLAANDTSDRGLEESAEQPAHERSRQNSVTSSESQRPSSRASTIRAEPPTDTAGNPGPSERPASTRDGESSASSHTKLARPKSDRLLKRPSFLHSRQSSQRSSVSSTTNKSDYSIDGSSNVAFSADYGLQTGGALPSNSTISRSGHSLTRLPSLSSVTSSISGYGDSTPLSEQTRPISGLSAPSGLRIDPALETLDEERYRPDASAAPETPRPNSSSTTAPTDTVITQHVLNIKVPETVAKEYREKHLLSPDKRSSAYPSLHGRSRGTLTLKEQNSKIDKLSKENFDLKLKIHFLDQALQKRSEEGVKELISQNVQLQTDLANERKECQAVRRQLREAERKLKTRDNGDIQTSSSPTVSDEERNAHSQQVAELEGAAISMKESLQQTEAQVNHLHSLLSQESSERHRLAELVKTVGTRKPLEPNGNFEESTDMWKDLLEAETARREQADEDAQRLRDELRRLKRDMAANGHRPISSGWQGLKRNLANYPPSPSGVSDIASEHNGVLSSSAETLVEQLRHENAELRRDLGAQTSMLTSRNRERERLQQEIEDLKLHQRRGGRVRSIAGDSILERSVSRAHQRSASRASAATKVTQISDAEREEYDRKQAALRDELAGTKLLNQELESELNAHLDALARIETEFETMTEERDLAVEDSQALQSERDEVLQTLQEKEADFESLREEALATIDKLEEEIEQKVTELNRISADLDTRNEDFAALQAEIKTVSANVVQLEDGRQHGLRKISNLEQELEDANSELETLDKRIQEANSKIERLEVQLESSQDEISFLREEQEGDKIKIGDLEAALGATQSNLQDEKENFKEMQERVDEEQKQREAIDNLEKNEVQQIINDLNSQIARAKDEVKRLRKSLSENEVEACKWKERLEELESGLREAVGDPNGTKSSLLKDIVKLHNELDATVHNLENTRNELAEREHLLRSRDTLLESTGLEARKLSDILEKERQSRKMERHHFEQLQRGHQSNARSMQQSEGRISELEAARNQEHRKVLVLEQQYRGQLLERNNLLLAMWNRLSTLCGAQWAQRNGLVDGEVPSLEVVNKNLPGFNRNVVAALRTVEGTIGNFRARIRNIEKDLWKDYQTLEHNLEQRTQRLEQLEKAVQSRRRPESRASAAPAPPGAAAAVDPESARLKSENKVLRAEVHFYRQAGRPTTPSHAAAAASALALGSSPTSPSASARPPSISKTTRAAALLRHHSTSAVEALRHVAGGHRADAPKAPSFPPLPETPRQQQQQQHQHQQQPQQLQQPQQQPPYQQHQSPTPQQHQQSQQQQQQPQQDYHQQHLHEPNEQRWIHRLKELERRLKAEREARLLDRNGARKRLEEGRAENQELKLLLEREREREQRQSIVGDEGLVMHGETGSLERV